MALVGDNVADWSLRSAYFLRQLHGANNSGLIAMSVSGCLTDQARRSYVIVSENESAEAVSHPLFTRLFSSSLEQLAYPAVTMIF